MPTFQRTATALLWVLFWTQVNYADPPATEADPPGTESVRDEEIVELFNQLGAGEFAVRERAADRLAELGIAALPRLRELVAQSNDPEVKLRGGQIIKQVTDGDLAGQIDAFLSGDNVDFPGWRIGRRILGDNLAIRELYVQLVKDHRQIVESLDLDQETTRDRVVALEKTIADIQDRTFNQIKMPTQADAFALVLALSIDDKVPITNDFEETILNVLRKEPGTKIAKDAQLSRPFKLLLTEWIARSRRENREEVLLLTMQWNLRVGVGLGVQTLADATDPQTLATAMQAISRFGDKVSIDFVLPLLNDDRIVVEQGFVRGQEAQTRLSDVAMATIARLNRVELSEIGFPENADHPVLSFDINQVGFAKNEGKARQKARQKIDSLLKKKSAVN